MGNSTAVLSNAPFFFVIIVITPRRRKIFCSPLDYCYKSCRWGGQTTKQQLETASYFSICNPCLQDQRSCSPTKTGLLALPEEGLVIKEFPTPAQTELASEYGCARPHMSLWASMNHLHTARHASLLGSPSRCCICSNPCILFKQTVSWSYAGIRIASW